MVTRRALVVGTGAIAVTAAAATYLSFGHMGSMADYTACVAETRALLTAHPQQRDLIRYATLAANSHNTQPWRFTLHSLGIDIAPDFTRRLSAVDPDDHHLFVSLGCAAENLAIAAAAQGLTGEVHFDPLAGGTVSFVFGAGRQPELALFDAIPQRQSTRGDFNGQPVPLGDLNRLITTASVPGVDLVLATDRAQIDQIRDLVVAGNSAQMADAAFLRELEAWLRFNPRQAITTGDGLFSAATGNPTLPTWLGPILLDFAFKPATENAKYARQIASSAGIAVFVAEKSDPEHWVRVGRACQRFALQATALGMKHAFVNQPVEVPHLRPELANIIGRPGRRPDVVMRFGYGEALPFSARRPVDAVLA